MLSYETSLKERYAGARARLWGGAPKVRICRPALPDPDDAPEPPPAAVEPRPLRILGIEELPPETPIEPIPRWKRIAKEVARKHAMRIADLTGPQRALTQSAARREAMYRCWSELNMTLSQIGRHFNRDHTSVLAAIRRYQEVGAEAVYSVKKGTRPTVWTADKLAMLRSMRSRGMSYANIGQRMGVSRESARNAYARSLENEMREAA